MNSYDITKSLYAMFDNFEYKLQNTYIFSWESDFFCIAKSSKYIYEIEVKVSRSDFKADFKKTTGYKNDPLKHDILKDSTKTFKPHKFFFACPEGLIQPSDIPKEYGLIWVYHKHGNYHEAIVKQKPSFLHKEDLFKSKHFLSQMLSKYYHRYLEVKHKLGVRQIDMMFNQQRLFDNFNY